MRYRQLAPGIEVSEVGFGNWTCTTGWWGDYTEDEAIALHRAAYDAGITFFDTSNAYREGYGEEVLGKALADVRDKVVIATKFGYDLDATDSGAASKSAHRTDIPSVRADLEASLRRLNVDTIDLLQLHNPRMAHLDDDELFDFLEAAKSSGKIRTYGVALGPKIGWLEEGVHGMRKRPGMGVLHMIYNLLEQDPGRELLTVAAQTNTKTIVRVPHSSGMLEGNLTADYVFPADDHRRHRPRSWLIEGVQKVAKLDFLAEDMTLGQAALKWILADDGVASTLPNFYGKEQIDEFAAAPDCRDLTSEELRRVSELSASNFGVTPESDRTTKVNAATGS